MVSGNSGAQEVDKLFDRSPEFYNMINGQYVVAQKMELVQVTRERLFDPENATWLPDMDPEEKDLFVQNSGLQGKRIERVSSIDYRCDVRTICPALKIDLVLEEGPHPVQIGNYPLWTYSSDMLNGLPNTPVDILGDPQTTVNKRESTATHILMTNASNGILIEEDIAEDPDVAHEIGKGRNRPGFYQVIAATNGQQKVHELGGDKPPTEFLTASTHSYEMAKELTPAVPAVQGVGEGPQSGVLFQAKVAQANVAMTFSRKFLMAIFQDIGDGYFKAVKQHYVFPMLMTARKQKGVYALNVPGGIQIEDIDRMRVTVSQSPSSETFRRQLLQQFSVIQQAVGGPLTKQAIGRLMIQSMPNVPEEELDELSAIAKLEEEQAKLGVLTGIVQGKFALMQLLGQAQAMAGGQMPGQLPAPGQPQGGGTSLQALQGMVQGLGGSELPAMPVNAAGAPGSGAPPGAQPPTAMPIGAATQGG